MKVNTILDQIDLGSIALPEFQRGYVWNRKQVRELMHSLYHRYPVGSLLVWVTETETADARGDGKLQPGIIKLLLDGQQRITTLYGLVRRKPPEFFDGNEKAFTGLYFNIDEEIFEFYLPLKMKDNPMWINVTDILKGGIGPYIKKLTEIPDCVPEMTKYIDRINNIFNIKEIDLHIEEVVGKDKTVDVVVDVFNKVNSGGTKLSKGDLALAKVCAEWPDARNALRSLISKWEKAGFYFKMDWLLRVVNAMVSGSAYFSALKDFDASEIKEGFGRAEKAVDHLLNLISSRLGLDHDRVLGSRYSFPLLAAYFAQRGNYLLNAEETGKLLYWYIHTFLWGRYAGSTESVLSQDLNILEKEEDSLDGLIKQLRIIRGDLRIRADDFTGWSVGARFYPFLYMLTRVGKARDWATGIELSQNLLGKLSGLQIHHIFPKSKLYEHEYVIGEVNALANFTFLTQETNLKVSNRDPEEYLEEFVEKHPGVIESHWIPMDRQIWKYENYRDFLEARRELLAKAANEFLDSLLLGSVPGVEKIVMPIDKEFVMIPGRIESEEEEQLLRECNNWLKKYGLPQGEFSYELVDESSGNLMAILDLAWPDGLQQGLSKPVALLINESSETFSAANKAGFIYFTDDISFRNYVKREILSFD